jgi:large subunit ribosomal protein L22
VATSTDPTYKARARFIRISPYKVREVAAIINGKHIDEARRILAFTPKAASETISKVLESAVANAEHNFSVPQEELYVKFISADEGVTIKRFRARAQGRGYRIRKRTSHINLELERRQPQAQPRPKRGEASKGAANAAPKSKAAAETGTAKTRAKPATSCGGRTKQDKQAGN